MFLKYNKKLWVLQHDTLSIKVTKYKCQKFLKKLLINNMYVIMLV